MDMARNLRISYSDAQGQESIHTDANGGIKL